LKKNSQQKVFKLKTKPKQKNLILKNLNKRQTFLKNKEPKNKKNKEKNKEKK